MGAALVTTREGLEASLIVGIVLGYLAKTGNRSYFRIIWLGTAAAVALSIITGAALFFTVGELEGRAEQIFEGIAMLSAVAVLTWMIFWMRKQAVNIKRELEARIAHAIAVGSAVGLASVVFFAVLREGWETALFLFAVSESSTPLVTGIGAVAGLVIYVVLAPDLYDRDGTPYGRAAGGDLDRGKARRCASQLAFVDVERVGAAQHLGACKPG